MIKWSVLTMRILINNEDIARTTSGRALNHAFSIDTAVSDPVSYSAGYTNAIKQALQIIDSSRINVNVRDEIVEKLNDVAS